MMRVECVLATQSVKHRYAEVHEVWTQLGAWFGVADVRRIRLAADDVNKVDSRWKLKFQKAIQKATEDILENAAKTGRLSFAEVDFAPLMMEHSLETMQQALDHSVDYMPRLPSDENIKRLAKAGRPPRAKVPTSFKALRELWDRYRKEYYIPQRQDAMAERVRKEYLRRVQEYWVRFGEQFRNGTTGERKAAVSEIMKGADVAYNRAKMIVETETTYYYNKTRTAVFDQSDDVTHYMFLAIRDHRTTEWCRSRHGLVYAKTDPLLQKERPPCFSGDTPVLTIEGWKDISTVTVGELVWTHENRWRRIEKIHRSDEKLVELLQIGFGLATTNHPYIERSTGIVEAELFKPEEGVWAGSADMQAMLKASLDAMVQEGSQVLLDKLQRSRSCSYAEWLQSSELEGRPEEDEEGLYWCPPSNASASEQARIRFGTPGRYGKSPRTTTESGGSGAPYQSEQNRQSSGESASDDKLGTHCIAQEVGRFNSTEVVYNLEVEEDHTYFAGGFLVHNCHWNCRSEVVPLTKQNPRHLALINDQAKARRHNSPAPLPPEWSARTGT